MAISFKVADKNKFYTSPKEVGYSFHFCLRTIDMGTTNTNPLNLNQGRLFPHKLTGQAKAVGSSLLVKRCWSPKNHS